MIPLGDLRSVGSGLARPECVLCTSDGALRASDWRGEVTLIRPDGTQHSVLAAGGSRLRPNGIALRPNGGWLLAHLGESDGGVYRLDSDGTLPAELLDVGGRPLPPTNYVHIDGQRRIWVTVSTRRQPRSLGYRADCDDGFIVLIDDAGERIVAEGLGHANECLIHPETGQLYVYETFGRRLTQFDVDATGNPTNRTTLAMFGPGTFPDGLTFDGEGAVWVRSIVGNRVIRVLPDRRQEIVLEDSDPRELERIEAAYRGGEMGRPHLDMSLGVRLRNVSSAAFGGADLRTVFLSCLLGDEILSFRSSVAGLKPAHWHWFRADADATE